MYKKKSVIRTGYRIAAKLSPTLGHILRESYYTLSGWRFDDLKRELIENGNRNIDSSLALRYSLDAAFNSTVEPGSRIAFISCLLPADTGIATCSLYSWVGYEGPLDVFGPATDMDWFFTQSQMLRGDGGGGPRLFDVGAFLTLNQIVKYHKIVIAIGNSNHHAYIFDLLKKLSTFTSLDQVVLYVHDPCLLNIIKTGTQIQGTALVGMLETIYGRKLTRESESQITDAELIKNEIFGARYFHRMGIRNFLVNSNAAHEIIAKDLSGLAVQIHKIFHPVFAPVGSNGLEHEYVDDTIVVGSYGVPGHSKRTDDIVRAVRILKERGHKVRLLIAGFHVNQYFRSSPRTLDGLDCELFDGPTDRQLVACMKKCTVAVQLRKHSLGESSGIVPQLLLMGKTVLVSDIGSFKELGDVVVKVPSSAGPSDIADKILLATKTPISKERTAQYCEDKSPRKFQERFLELYGRRQQKNIQLVGS